MQKFTLSFIFTPDYEKVLLIHKNRPDWQAGKINGIGGHTEEGETSLECIAREVQEETTLQISHEDWQLFCTKKHTDWLVDSYIAIYDGELNNAKTNTDEKIEWFNVDNLPKNILENINWLAPMAIDAHKNASFKPVTVDYIESHS